jgi:YHS domain-containing protein
MPVGLAPLDATGHFLGSTRSVRIEGSGPLNRVESDGPEARTGIHATHHQTNDPGRLAAGDPGPPGDRRRRRLPVEAAGPGDLEGLWRAGRELARRRPAQARPGDRRLEGKRERGLEALGRLSGPGDRRRDGEVSQNRRAQTGQRGGRVRPGGDPGRRLEADVPGQVGQGQAARPDRRRGRRGGPPGQPSSKTFARLGEVGYTRNGVAFASGESGPLCIVTEGRGTISVSYKGKSYYVCCSGCKDLFNKDPESILAEAAERAKKAKAAK